MQIHPAFYHNILEHPILHSSSMNIANNPDNSSDHSDEDPEPNAYTRPMLVMGDFNLNATKYTNDTIDSTDYSLDESSFSFTTGPATSADNTANPQKLWHEFLQRNFFECTHARDIRQLLPTFRRGSSASTIDYLYASPILHQSLQTSDIEFISSQWTDHATVCEKRVSMFYKLTFFSLHSCLK
jgi:endonuclease/exonuclease/phosphatase family metal-dependent hydrolase